MELNAKCPFVWDWDSLVMLPSRAVEVPKKFEVVDSVFEAIDGFEPGSLNSSGGRSDGVSGGSASDLVYGSSSKSSKSASVDSSSNRETRESKFTLETSKSFSQNPGSVKQLANAWPSPHRTSPTADISIGSSELLIGLKLGKRTYFEDASASANSRTSVSVSGTFDATVKRSKLSNIAIPRCQVEGCNLDLSSAKSYHRKHRVCENHSKSPKVVICGLERRFCQQCSRFHSLSEFDQKKRSCRRRLCDHNARRRKPKPEIIRFNSMTLPPPLHGRANQMNLAFNQVTMQHTRPNVSSTWDFTSNSKYTQQDKLSLFSPVKTGDVGELHESCIEPEDTGFKLSYDSSQLLSSSKLPSTPVFHQGLQMPTTLTSNSTTNMEATQDDLRALSLLSTNSWGVSSCDQVHPPPPPPSLQHHFDNYGSTTTTNTTATLPSQSPSSNPSFTAAPQLHVASSASVLSTHFWQVDRNPASPSVQKVEGNSHFQEHQLFKASNESGFYLY